MKIKGIFSLLLMGLSLFVATSCDDDDATAPVAPDSVSIGDESLNFPGTGGTASTTFTVSGAEFSIIPDNSGWYDYSTRLIEKDHQHQSYTLIVTANANTADNASAGTRASVPVGSSRTASITIRCGNASGILTLNQDAPDPMIVADFTKKYTPGDIPDISGSAEDAVKFAESLGFGWNMGNHMDAWYTADGKEISSETCWGNKEATAETFMKVKEAGYASVRIPITWLGHIGAAPSYTIEEAWLNRVAQLVDWAEEAGLKVIINMHHDGANSEHWLDVKNAALDASVNEKIEAQFSAMWKQIAEKFKDKGNFLIFEPFNEIHDGGWGWGDNRTDGGKQYAIVNGWNQLFVNTVRATGGNNATRYLAVIGYDTDIELTIDNLKLPTDVVENRLIVGVHCYDPYLYTLENQFAQWGHVADSSLAPGDKESTLSNRMKKMKDAFVDKGIPVYFGEMGCSERDNETDEVYRRYYLHYFAKAARTYGFAAMVWDNGAEGGGREHHAYINHSTGEYPSDNAKAAVEAMINGYFCDDPDFTLDYVYEHAPNYK